MARYKVNVGINYRGKRAEPGVVVDDLKPGEAEWMLRDGVIEQLVEPRQTARKGADGSKLQSR